MRIVEVTGTTARHAVITMRRSATPLKFLLIPMAHVACPQFYEQVRARLEDCDLIVAEGIRGKAWPVSALTMSYRFSARWRRGRLVLQDYTTLLPAGVPVINPDISATEAISDLRALGRWTYFPLVLGAPLFGLVATARGPRMFLGQGLEVKLPPTRVGVRMPHLDHGRMERAMLERRDRLLVDALEQIHAERRRERITVAVVYGAGHIPAVYAALLVHHGYRPGKPQWLTAIVA